MHNFKVTRQHLADRPSVEAFFRKCAKLTHYTRLAEEIRKSPVCWCATCNSQRGTTGMQLRLL